MEKFSQLVAAAIGAVMSFFCGVPPIMWVLLAAMTLDFVTGLLCGLLGKSPKTETGGISSKAAFAGLLKKMLIVAVVLLACLLDWAVSTGAGVAFSAVTGATCLWFIASEGISIVENAAEMGVPIPGILMHALEAMRKSGESPEDQQTDDPQ